MLSQMSPPRVCPDHAREIILEWLMPLTEDGVIDDVMRVFIDELRPYAGEAARRALRQQFGGPSPEVLIAQLRTFLAELLKLLEDIQLDPDMMAVSFAAAKPINEAVLKLQNWIEFIDHRHVSSAEMAVPPAADVILQKGGVP